MLQHAMEGKKLSWPVDPCAGVPWSEEEHRTFLLGLQKLGKVRRDLLAKLPTKHLGDIYDRLSTKCFSRPYAWSFALICSGYILKAFRAACGVIGPSLPFRTWAGRSEAMMGVLGGSSAISHT